VPWCSDGSSSFILLTKSGFCRSGFIVSAVRPDERSTEGPAEAADPVAPPPGPWRPDKMFCKSESWMLDPEAAAVATELVVVAGPEDAAAAAAVVVVVAAEEAVVVVAAAVDAGVDLEAAAVEAA
jgi:hypothetical protein